MRLASELRTRKNLPEGDQVLAGVQKAKKEPDSVPVSLEAVQGLISHWLEV